MGMLLRRHLTDNEPVKQAEAKAEPVPAKKPGKPKKQ